jgi:hypothetical protein
MGITTCLIRAASTTIIFDNGTSFTVPRKDSEPREKTATSVARVLRVDRFDYL